jgi:hypothetical protein
VIKRDARVAPFDEDKICRSIFAAGERVIGPDPFLARELTDGVLHFLSVDGAAPSMRTSDIAEAVAKVVRELGHPALALRYAGYRSARTSLSQNGSDGATLPANRRSPTPDEIYPPNLAAAEREGLLHFFDFDCPRELAGGVLTPAPAADGTPAAGWVEAIEETRQRIGRYIAIDGPEYVLANPGSPGQSWSWVRELRIGLRLTGLQAIVNVNCQRPPDSALANADGPLFAASGAQESPRYSHVRDSLLEYLVDGASDNLRVDWHLSDRDFEPARRGRLLRMAKRVIEGAPITFVPDRRGRPIALAEGLDRDHTVAAGVVGISLTRLAEIVGTGTGAPTDPTRYLSKLGALARLALGAGRARREFLRRHGRPQAAQGFSIHRGRLVVVPIGLDDVVRQVTGQPLTEEGPGLNFARQIMQSLRTAIASPSSGDISACLDSAPPVASNTGRTNVSAGAKGPAVGPVRQQVRVAGALQSEIQAGTAEVRLPDNRLWTPDEIAQLLWLCWRQPGIVRVRFLRAVRANRQLTAGWDVQSAQ